MPAGDRVTDAQRAELARVVRAADRATGLSFCVHVGSTPGGREEVLGMLARRGSLAADTVLVAVDPVTRRLEIATGARAATYVDDRTCALAALAMTSSFSAGDLVGGLRNGVQVLADHGRHAQQRHLETY